MIYTTATYANAEHTLVQGTDAHGKTETRSIDSPHEFRRADEFITGFLAGGGVIAPFEEPPLALPDLVPYQFRAMLKLSGKQDDLYAALNALPEPDRTVAQSKLEYSLAFRRDSDLVVAAKHALDLTDAKLDALWLQASQIL